MTPTFNRKDELVHLFSSMKKQTLDPKFFEMIISDDGSTDGTEEYVKSLENKFNFNLLYVSKKILAWICRNNGVKNSKGELIVFIDSDCEADSNWLEIILMPIKIMILMLLVVQMRQKITFYHSNSYKFFNDSFLTTGGIRGITKI